MKLRGFDTINSQMPENYIAPRTPVEQVLAKIFIEVLGVKRVGIHLSGDSL